MAPKERKPLGLTCTSTACADNLHCFRQAKKKGEEHVKGGRCVDCGADLVDFPRVHLREHGDLAYTFDSLRFELIRHHFWHVDFDQKALNYALRKGRVGMLAASEKRIRQAIAPAEPAFDGRQTGMSGNPLYYAQHATATCCRKCIEYWHGIPQGKVLTEEQINYCVGLVNKFVAARLPTLKEYGEKVPPIRRATQEEGSE
jgi:hypothetical protein